jgi:hypothetical protein
MSRFAGYLTGVLASAVCLAGGLSFAAMAQGAPPNFAPDASIGWYAYNRLFIPPAIGAGPVLQDPAHPYVSNDEFRVTGRQPTQQLADLSNPILQPWARDIVRKRNELVLSGKPAYSPHASCWPAAVASPYTAGILRLRGCATRRRFSSTNTKGRPWTLSASPKMPPTQP